MILLVAVSFQGKELPLFDFRWHSSGFRLTVYGLVGDMVTATDAQVEHNPKAVKLESVELEKIRKLIKLHL